MNFSIYYTLSIIILMSLFLMKEVVKPSIIVFSALMLLVMGGVINVDEAFAGFSNQGMLTVGFLFVVSAALQSSGAFYDIINRLLGKNKYGTAVRYFRLMIPVASFSAFLNNTPIVASLIPVIKSWSKRNNVAASKFLIPLSYAAILGGICTLIGTSTNLVVHGMLTERGFDGFGFFEISKVGIPVAVFGILFVALIGHYVLPSNKDPMVQLGENTREFVVEMKVGPEYKNVGMTIEEANLRHLQGLFLFQINRADMVIAPVAPDEKIYADDRLFFTGLPDTIYELQRTSGLHVIKDTHFDLKDFYSDKMNTYEAVVSNTSPLLGQTVRDSNFRRRYNAVILAIHRAGARVNKKVGDIIFHPGDTLFMLAKKGFDTEWYNTQDFSLVTSSVDIYAKPKWKGNVALGLLLAMILAAAFKLVPIVIAAAVTAIIMTLFNIISTKDA